MQKNSSDYHRSFEANHSFLSWPSLEVRSASRIHYLHLSQRGLPNARNEGLARACGEIALFLDDDVILIPGIS
jgi:glycosyltransferase involved in cell wall biosynthesis